MTHHCKRRLGTVISLAALAAVLGACGGNGNDADLLGSTQRGTGDICSFVTPPKPPQQQLWSDAEGWGHPEYSTTLRLADLDGDGRAELVGRGPNGLIVRTFAPGSRSWLPGGVSLALSDAAGWNRPERYGSIRLADLDGDRRPELLALTDEGPRAWKYNASADGWVPTDPAPTHEAWRAPDRNSELLADVDGDGLADRVVRSSSGIRTQSTASSTGRVEPFTAGIQGFPPFTGNQLTAYNYISLELLDGASGADIRSQYSNQALSQNFASAYPTKLGKLSAPGGVAATDWTAVVKQLSTEFGYVANVLKWFSLHETFLGELNNSKILSVAIVSGKLQFPSDSSKDNDSVGFNIFSMIARIIQAIAALTGQPEVSAIAGIFSTVSSAAATFGGESPTQPSILAAVVGLEDKLNTHFQNAILANGCLADYYLQDLALLESLGLPIAQGTYKWDETLNGKLLAAARPGYELTLWQALAPVVWEKGNLATTCIGQGQCEIPGEMSSYPGGYYYLEQDDDQIGVFYVLKIKGTRIDQGEPFAPALAALNPIFRAPPNGLGSNLYDVLTGQDRYSGESNGWNFTGPTPN
jgi:hypothetical protein